MAKEQDVSALLSELELKDRMIAEESMAKYRAYERIAELQEEVRQLQEKLKNDD